MHTGHLTSSHSLMSLAAAVLDGDLGGFLEEEGRCFGQLDELLGKGDPRERRSKDTERAFLSFGIVLNSVQSH